MTIRCSSSASLVDSTHFDFYLNFDIHINTLLKYVRNYIEVMVEQTSVKAW